MTRPQLPLRHANPKIKRILESNPPPQVKYQMLNCQGREILVGRLKVETPTENGHAFILRRFDTGAVSLTTMYRAAFPLAGDLEERAELQWVKDNYDLSGNNGSSKETHITRLAGTWVSPTLAVEIADQYGLAPLIKIVVDAQPDPNTTYKKSARAAAASSASAITTLDGNRSTIAASTTLSPQLPRTTITTAATRSITVSATPARSIAKSLPASSPAAAQPNPPKRRKESSPAPQILDSSPMKAPSRRSNRAKSPVTKPASTPINTPARSPKKRVEQTTPSSDKTVVEEEGDKITQVVVEELHDQDVHEQKKLIADLKAQRAAAEQEVEQAKQAQAEGDDEEAEEAAEGETSEEASGSKKRERDEDEPEYQFEFKEPEVGERAIATNRRVGFQLEPRTRSFAWGVAAFAVGMGAISMLPTFL